MIIFKSPEEIEHIRKASQLTAATLTELAKLVKPGVSTLELDQFAEEYIRSHGGIPSCIGYYGYPATICASVNHEVVHGIPSASRILKDGDVISIDLVSSIDGYHGDSAITVPVGEVKPKVYELLKVTEECLFKGIEQAVAGNHVGDISHAVQSHAERHRYGVVRGKPSKMKPALQSSLDKRSRTMPMVTLSGTNCPASIYFLASNPNGVDSFTAARNMSPVEI